MWKNKQTTKKEKKEKEMGKTDLIENSIQE